MPKPTVNQRMSAVLGIAQQTMSALQPDDPQVVDITPALPGCEPNNALVPATQSGGALVPPAPPAPPEIISNENHHEDVKGDYDYVRKTLYHLIEKGNEALDHLLPLAKESENPRGFEVTHMLLKTTSEMAKDLIDLHRLMNEVQSLENKKEPEGVTNIQNNTAVFVGTTAELQATVRKAMLERTKQD